MGETGFVNFQQAALIGTENLNGYSIVMIVSNYGAILAHIPPQPPDGDPNDLFAGDENVKRMMNDVQSYYSYYQMLFPVASTHVVCALFNGVVALEDQMRIMTDRFNEMGLATEIHHYDVPVDQRVAGQGFVVIIADRGPVPQVYVQDRLVAEFSGDAHGGQAPVPGPSSAQGPTTMQGSSGAHGTSAYAMGQGFATTPGSRWTPSMHGTVQGSTTTLESNLTAQGSATMSGITHESTTTLDSSWAQRMHGAGQGLATTPTDIWVRVDVEVKKHTFRGNEYIFYIQNRPVSTAQESWRPVSLREGGEVWTYRGRRTNDNLLHASKHWGPVRRICCGGNGQAEGGDVGWVSSSRIQPTSSWAHQNGASACDSPLSIPATFSQNTGPCDRAAEGGPRGRRHGYFSGAPCRAANPP